MTNGLWWREQGITKLVAGVFEGGGAKGVLYRGALEGMLAEGCWFGAAAGASAGAITATLIAAGMRPDQLGAATEAALEKLQTRPTHRSALLRIHNGASYLDQDSLRLWLHGLLAEQIEALWGEPDRGDITFAELHELTDGFELDVVAVDLTRHHRVVFNYLATPSCSVASAVIASAAIPLAFEPPLLWRAERPGAVIVDGGVLANFPSFVFRDASYREWAGLPALTVPVLGFLLDEDAETERIDAASYQDSAFPADLADSATPPEEIPRAARKVHPFRPRAAKPTVAGSLARATGRVLGAITWPIWKLLLVWIPALLRWNAGGHRGSWPQPRSPAVRSLVGWFDGVMTGLAPWSVLLGALLVTTACIGIGAYFVAWRPLVDHLGEVLNGERKIADSTLGTLFYVLFALAPVYAWMAISMFLLVGWTLHYPVQIAAYGLAKTFLAGSGAPVWTGTAPDDHVVRLQVPPGIDTLTVRLSDAEVDEALAAAAEATRAGVRRALAPADAAG